MTAPFDQSLKFKEPRETKYGNRDRNVLDIMFSKAPDNVLVCVNIIRLFFRRFLKKMKYKFFRCTGFLKNKKKIGACFK